MFVESERKELEWRALDNGRGEGDILIFTLGVRVILLAIRWVMPAL
jgi:hypothetical protein